MRCLFETFVSKTFGAVAVVFATTSPDLNLYRHPVAVALVNEPYAEDCSPVLCRC